MLVYNYGVHFEYLYPERGLISLLRSWQHPEGSVAGPIKYNDKSAGQTKSI